MKKLFKKLKLCGLIVFTLFDIFLIYSCFYFGYFIYSSKYINSEDKVNKEKFDDSLEYVVIASPIGETIDEEYIKFYITDEDGKYLTKNEVMKFSDFDFEKDGSSRIIYEGKFTKDKTKQILNLRIWISDKYDLDDVPGFSYQLNILTK